jgi:hypothetical protein
VAPSFTEAREPVIAAIVRVRHADESKIEFEKNYVRLSDCQAGMGSSSPRT